MISRIDNIILSKLNEGYDKHKKIANNIASLIVDKKENNSKTDSNLDPSSSLEFHMAELIKNSSKYNSLARFFTERIRIYESSIKGRWLWV